MLSVQVRCKAPKVLNAASAAAGYARTFAEILAFGNGIQGALGLKREDDEYEPESVQIPGEVAGIGTGHYHSFAVLQNGQLWSWGRNNELQLGRDREDSPFGHADSTPGRVKGFPQVQVTCATGSGVASFACTATGDLFSWGSSKRGQLGLGSHVLATNEPLRVAALKNIVQVCSGWGHALASDDQGHVFSWGFPQHGRLGHSVRFQEEEADTLQQCVWIPKRLDALSGVNVKQIACGLDFSLALSDEGHLFSFGENSLGQLGRGHNAHSSSEAQDWLIKDDNGRCLLFESIAAGLGHCVGITQSGELFAWGWASAGQLGLGDTAGASSIAYPRNISKLSGLTGLQGSLLAASRVHSLISTGSKTYACGSGRNGRLGSGSEMNSPAFDALEALHDCPLLQIACGLDHTMLLVKS